ncbi:Bet1-like SNARE 1-2 [Dionaea muscipula]
MNYRRDHRTSKAALLDGLDGIEEGGLRASSSYSSDIDEHDNEKAIDSLKDKVIFLKRLTGDIHDEVLGHNRLLDRVGNSMDASRGILSGTVDRFRMVFEKKSGRKMCILVGCFVAFFVVFYYLTRVLRYFM